MAAADHCNAPGKGFAGAATGPTAVVATAAAAVAAAVVAAVAAATAAATAAAATAEEFSDRVQPPSHHAQGLNIAFGFPPNSDEPVGSHGDPFRCQNYETCYFLAYPNTSE